MRYVMKKSDQTVQNKKWCVACVDEKNSRLSSKTPLHATDPGPATENQSCCCIILQLLGMLLQCISCSGDAILCQLSFVPMEEREFSGYSL
jgi:hypothetical protein